MIGPIFRKTIRRRAGAVEKASQKQYLSSEPTLVDNTRPRDNCDSLESIAVSTWVPPGHFYSPLVDPDDPVVSQTLAFFEAETLPVSEDFQLDETAMMQLLENLSPLCGDIPFPAFKEHNFRYYFENPAFAYGDGIIYFGMLRWLRPRRIVEIGCGFSSCLAMDTNDLFFNGSINLTFIDPYPDILFGLLHPNDPYRQTVLRRAVQEVDISVFEKLETDDILFIDSSHVAKMGSDVNDYLFRIFPRLQNGVVIHIHDIFYPFQYGSEWIRNENRSWNEAYILRAFLQYNSKFKVIYFNHFMAARRTVEVAKRLPLCLKNGGGSIWLRKC